MSQSQDMQCESYRDLSKNQTCLTQILPKTGCGNTQTIDSFCCINQFHNQCIGKCKFDTQLSDNWIWYYLENPQTWEDCLGYSNISQYLVPTEGNNLKFIQSTNKAPSTLRLPRTEIVDCYVDLCGKSQACSSNSTAQSLCSIESLSTNSLNSTTNILSDCKAAICSSTTVNQDIAGIGVFVSFMIQMSLLFITLYVPMLRFTHFISQKFFRSFTKFVIDFQKAQCFLALAISISSLHSLRRHDTDLSDLDQHALGTILGGGILPIVFSQFNIIISNHGKILPWVVFLLSTCTWLFTVILVQFIVRSSTVNVSEREPSTKCHGSSVTIVCGRLTGRGLSVRSYLGTIPIMTFCVWWQLRGALSRFQWYSSLERSFISSRHRLGWDKRILYAFIFILLSGFAATYGLWIRNYVGLKYHVRDEWTFGQVVALMIWFPIFVDILQFVGKRGVKFWRRRAAERDLRDELGPISEIENAEGKMGDVTATVVR